MVDKIHNISNIIKSKKINKAIFTSSEKPIVKFSNLYDPTIKSNKIIKNSLNLSKSKIITGPNASGKTTLIKSTLINLLISQQIGFGFYNKAEITPFDTFH